MAVSGMGEIKIAKYGEAFLQVIRAHEAAAMKARQQVSELARMAQMTPSRPGKRPQSVAPRPSVRIVEPPPTAPLSPPRPPLEDDDEALADAYLSGVTIQEMADELGVSTAVIRQRLQDMDLIF